MSLNYASWGEFAKEVAQQQSTNKPALTEILAQAASGVQATAMRSSLERLTKIGVVASTNLVEVVTPTNAREERGKWLEEAKKGNFTCPRYCYNAELLTKIVTDFMACSDELKNLHGHAEGIIKHGVDLPSTVLAIILQNLIVETQCLVGVVEGILTKDDSQTAHYIADLYGRPTDDVVKQARQYAVDLQSGNGLTQCGSELPGEAICRLKKMKFDAEGIKRVFQWVAARCGFDGTRPIEISETATSIDVRDKSSIGPVVVIPKDRVVSGLKLVKLAAHEVLCHWLDSENLQPFLTGALKSHDEILYEGHAMVAERQVSLMLNGSATVLPEKHWYIIAMDMAKNDCNFSMVAKELYPMIKAVEESDEKAYDLTYLTCLRVFRGATNTANGGYAFTKDRAYFEGALLVDELRKVGFGNLSEFGAMSTTTLLHLANYCRLDTENLKYAYNANLLKQLVARMIKGKFSS